MKINVEKKIAFPVKLYCLSLAVEPLLFFVLSDPHETGLAITLSRLLQIWVVLYFFAFIIKKGLTFPNPWAQYYSNYFGYVVVGIFSSLLGAFYFDSYALTLSLGNMEESSEISKIIRGTYSRPFVEIAVSIYYFVYFIISPRYVLKDRVEIKFLLDLMVKVFTFSLVIGIIDIVQFLFTGVNFIPRHLIDSRFIELGTRYHGLAGEPRDAFPYLVFGLAMYFLRSALFKCAPPSRKVIGLTTFAIIMTQSASGLIGVIFALFIYVYTDLRITIARIIQMIVAFIFGSGLVYLIVLNTDRLMDYVVAAEGIYEVLKSSEKLPPILFAQSSNIFPLWQFYLNIGNFNIIEVFLGSGFGSSSFINKNLGGMDGLVNPQSNAIRLIYEVGFFGFWLYLTSQIKLIRLVCKNYLYSNGRIFYLLAILLIGICLGHRSTTIFILCGVALAVVTTQRSLPKSS
jgi:hypothetical protein